MKHVVIIGKYYPPEFGGIERYTRDVADVAVRGHRVTVVVHNRERSDQFEHDGNITIIRCGTTKVIRAQPISPSMLTHLRSLQPDLVHFNAPNFWGAAMLSLASYKAPLIITHHADVFGRPFLKRLVMPIYRRLARRATCIVVNSAKNVAVSKDLPEKVSCIVEIPWGVDPNKYSNVDETERVAVAAERRRCFGDAPIVGFVGRFVRYKALPVLVEALSQVPHVHAVFIGDGPLRAEIVAQVAAARIAERVHFLGNLDEDTKIRTMRMMDMLTLPSNDTTEAFGLSQVEAQLLGLPVIATRLPTGVTDVTLHEITGLLVPPNDPGALANAITRLVKDSALTSRLGSAGRERALRLFTLDTFRDRWTEIYNTVLSGQPLDAHKASQMSL